MECDNKVFTCNTLFISDWLLPVDVGNFFFPNHVNILVSLCVIPFIGVVSTFVPFSAHNKWYQSLLLDPRSKTAKFMGFSKGVKGYRLWYPETSKIVNSRDVTFDESGMFLQKIENNDEALKQVKKMVFSHDMVAPIEEPIVQVDNNFNVLEQEEQSLVNERVEEP